VNNTNSQQDFTGKNVNNTNSQHWKTCSLANNSVVVTSTPSLTPNEFLNLITSAVAVPAALLAAPTKSKNAANLASQVSNVTMRNYGYKLLGYSVSSGSASNPCMGIPLGPLMDKPVATWTSPDDLITVCIHLGRETVPFVPRASDTRKHPENSGRMHITYCREWKPEAVPWFIVHVNNNQNNRRSLTGWFKDNVLSGLYACSGGDWYECDVTIPDDQIMDTYHPQILSPCLMKLHPEPSFYLDSAIKSVLGDDVTGQVGI
jgi:hypothetical protein